MMLNSEYAMMTGWTFSKPNSLKSPGDERTRENSRKVPRVCICDTARFLMVCPIFQCPAPAPATCHCTHDFTAWAGLACMRASEAPSKSRLTTAGILKAEPFPHDLVRRVMRWPNVIGMQPADAPSSCARTATTSGSLHCSMRVSYSTMRLFLKKPYLHAQTLTYYIWREHAMASHCD